MSRYFGVDLHRDCFTVCMRSESGKEVLREFKLKNICKFTKRLCKDDEVAVELTTNTRFFRDKVAKYVKRVVVINPWRFKIISESVNKTDKNDAKRIAYFLQKDMLPELHLKTEEMQQLYSLCHTRDKLVGQRTQLKNKINNCLAADGVLLKREELSSKKALDKVLKLKLNRLTMVELEVLVCQIKSLNDAVKTLDKAIEEEALKSEDVRLLASIKGVGVNSAAIFVSLIGDINNFESEKKLASFFGVVPWINNSNKKEHSGKITKRGSNLGRKSLVQCALIVKRFSPYFSEYHTRIKKRRCGGKANIATARKLVTLIYHTLKNRWKFTDFVNFEYEIMPRE